MVEVSGRKRLEMRQNREGRVNSGGSDMDRIISLLSFPYFLYASRIAGVDLRKPIREAEA